MSGILRGQMRVVGPLELVLYTVEATMQVLETDPRSSALN